MIELPDEQGRPGGPAAENAVHREIRRRAREGAAAAFPPAEQYGQRLFGHEPGSAGPSSPDPLDAMRLVPPVFVPRRLEKLIELGREPMHWDVDLRTTVGGLASTLPLYLSAFGSTQIASADLGVAASRQAGQLGIPMVIGENIVPMNGYGRLAASDRSLINRVRAYLDAVPDGVGGITVQQSTEDADAEVWNLVYSDPSAGPLLESGRLAFELKIGQGAKPGLGGMTLLDREAAAAVGDRFGLEPLVGRGAGAALRCASAGTVTEEILRQQVRLMRNNYPRARVWVKLHPGRDVADAAHVAWSAGADAVTVDGAEGGTGWAPSCFIDDVGLPLVECLLRLTRPECLLVSGGMWEGARVVKSLALGATAAGLGRAGLLATATDPEAGLVRFVECLAFELRLLISALGKYTPRAVDRADLWSPAPPRFPAPPPRTTGPDAHMDHLKG